MRIAFYPAQGGKPWNGQTIYEEALGGSETAVICMARELAHMGHEVLVFTRATPGLYDDVVYIDYTRARALLRTLPLDLLVCARDPMPLLWSHRATMQTLWFHDLPQGGSLPNAHQYWFVSNWQRAMFIQHAGLPAERCQVVPNGIDTSLFPSPPPVAYPIDPKGPVNLVWTSNPERGLWYAGQVLERVRKEFREAELHVYGRNAVYGWDSSFENNFLPDRMTHVVLHEAQNKKDLAKALQGMDVWVYPTWWPETYCIAAVEAQMAGVPVVASQFGALQETCSTQTLIPGAAWQEGHVEAIAKETLRLLKDPEARKDLSERGRAFAQTQTWRNSAHQLISHVNSFLGMKAA